MFLFGSFERNPFRVNAFTISVVSPNIVKPKDIKDLIKGRTEQLEDRDEVSIPAGPGEYRVTTADLTGSEERLCDPNRRLREELLAPEEHPPRHIDGVNEFQLRRRLTPKAADELLRFEPLDVTPVLVAALPKAPLRQLAAKRTAPAIPKLPQSPLSPAALLVKARDRRG